MAHAANPTGLAQQTGTSQPWKTVLAAIAVLAIGLALVIAVMFVNSRAVAPATGRDDSMIEAQRDATLLAGGTAYSTSAGVQALAPSSDIFDPMTIHQWRSAGRDDSVIEAQRDATLLSGKPAVGVPAAPAVVDESYNEALRGVARATGLDVGVIEAQRDVTLLTGTAAAAARAETRLDAISVDRKYQEIQSHGK